MDTTVQSQPLTWSAFNAIVDGLCPLESKRIFGVMNPSPVWSVADGSSSYYRNQIRQAILDLQNFIPEFTKNLETIYFPADFVSDGRASVGTMPPAAKLRSAWYYNYSPDLDYRERKRFKVVELPWEQRFEMTTREMADRLNSNYVTLTAAAEGALAMAQSINVLKGDAREHVGVMAISPQHDKFYAFPRVCGGWVFSIFWDGQKLDYRESELTPFDEETAQVVADYVIAQFAAYVERDAARAELFGRQYVTKRGLLYVRLKEKGNLT
jgi:hypothetical protein